MKIDAVLKIGGSLSRGTGLKALCEEISELGKTKSLLIIPGGGDFAEQVRTADRRFHLNQTAAHNMALLAMDQYGYLLHHLAPGSCLSPDIDLACCAAFSGRTAILLPAALLMKENPLPHSWQVTSDSIAAWVALRMDCARLVLLKDVDGLWDSRGEIASLSVDQLAAHAGGVDEYLSKILDRGDLETWIVNGLHPKRLSELLEKGRTTGTRIRKE